MSICVIRNPDNGFLKVESVTTELHPSVPHFITRTLKFQRLSDLSEALSMYFLAENSPHSLCLCAFSLRPVYYTGCSPGTAGWQRGKGRLQGGGLRAPRPPGAATPQDISEVSTLQPSEPKGSFLNALLLGLSSPLLEAGGGARKPTLCSRGPSFWDQPPPSMVTHGGTSVTMSSA